MSGIVTAGFIGAGTQILGGLFGMGAAKKRERAAAAEKAGLQRKLNSLENSRQAIVNPAEGVSNLSGLAQDLSSSLSNPFGNLSVATQAAEMQIEQADISLANTLDTLRATGSGAGGATALAQAALQSKKGVSASIEKQEANNEQLRARGEQQLNQMRMQEGARVQGLQIGEGGRVQGMEMQGRQFAFNAQENREGAQLDRVSAQLAGAAQRESQAQSDRTGALTGMISGVGSAVGGVATGLAAQNASPFADTMTGNNFTNAELGQLSSLNTTLSNAIWLSDRRLKKNIKLIGYSPKGLKIYAFEYKNNKLGEGVFQGVMSDEIPNKAVVKNSDGFDRVNYSKLDVEFKLIK
tara:strand:- start:1725 stop:2780 length:1056 start_codon:yes stop_codon:yes gene_type:complete